MRKRRRKGVSRMALNRFLYFCIILFFFIFAWVYGGRMLYLALYALLFLPVFSFALTFLMLRGLEVTQGSGVTRITKNEPGRYVIGIHNRTPLMFSNIVCQFIDNHFAVETNRELQTIFARPFMREKHEINFAVKYRGEYRLGLYALRLNDMLGLFTLKRKLKTTIALTVWPKLTEIYEFPLARNILSQSNSNFEIREEDYSAVSDVRKYEPTDPLKRVHWKLTAKKNEWMVKNFQTNALNKVTFLTDTFKPSDVYEDALILEDLMVETVISVADFCLRNAMPVEWIARTDVKREAANHSHFEALFYMAAELNFDGSPEGASVLPMLNKCLNETSGYVNAVAFAFRLDGAFYERALYARHLGHSVTVVYISGGEANRKTGGSADRETREVIDRLIDNGVDCLVINGAAVDD